jgi:hypothetical protein
MTRGLAVLAGAAAATGCLLAAGAPARAESCTWQVGLAGVVLPGEPDADYGAVALRATCERRRWGCAAPSAWPAWAIRPGRARHCNQSWSPRAAAVGARASPKDASTEA